MGAPRRGNLDRCEGQALGEPDEAADVVDAGNERQARRLEQCRDRVGHEYRLIGRVRATDVHALAGVTRGNDEQLPSPDRHAGAEWGGRVKSAGESRRPTHVPSKKPSDPTRTDVPHATVIVRMAHPSGPRQRRKL